MRRCLVLLLLVFLLLVPINAFADSDAIDKGNIFFKIGTLFTFDYYWDGYFDGPYEMTVARFGSGSVYLRYANVNSAYSYTETSQVTIGLGAGVTFT